MSQTPKLKLRVSLVSFSSTGEGVASGEGVARVGGGVRMAGWHSEGILTSLLTRFGKEDREISQYSPQADNSLQ